MREVAIAPEDVIIKGRHVELTQGLKDHVLDKLQRIELFGKKKVRATVTLEVGKHEHKAEIDFHFDHTKINVHASTQELYGAIDKASEKLTSQLRKYKERLQNHHNRPLHAVDLNVHVIAPSLEDEINDQIEEKNIKEIEKLWGPHAIVSTSSTRLKTLTAQEAVMKMELSQDSFLIFRSEEDQKIKVIYRRKDDNFGLIAVE